MLKSFVERTKRRIWRGREHLQQARQYMQYPRRSGRPWEIIEPTDRDKHYRLAACLIFKDEADYLEEWIDFHNLIGVEKFFLYNNNSKDDYRRVLAPYIAAGVVTLHDFPLLPPIAQKEAYNACIRTYRGHARWIAFIDIDEFMYATDSDSLPEVLRDYEDFAAVAVNWLMFSTSGHILKPEGLVIENYTRCQVEGNRHVRLIVNPLKVQRFVTAHEATYGDGGHAVNERKEEVCGPYSMPPSIARLRVNHYWTRSVEEFFLKKLSRGDVGGVTDLRNIHGLITAEKHYNNGADRAISRFIARLKSNCRLNDECTGATIPRHPAS
jgi:Glycosyltransferase family 92